jgi:hypothetical protein
MGNFLWNVLANTLSFVAGSFVIDLLKRILKHQPALAYIEEGPLRD